MSMISIYDFNYQFCAAVQLSANGQTKFVVEKW